MPLIAATEAPAPTGRNVRATSSGVWLPMQSTVGRTAVARGTNAAVRRPAFSPVK